MQPAGATVPSPRPTKLCAFLQIVLTESGIRQVDFTRARRPLRFGGPRYCACRSLVLKREQIVRSLGRLRGVVYLLVALSALILPVAQIASARPLAAQTKDGS